MKTKVLLNFLILITLKFRSAITNSELIQVIHDNLSNTVYYMAIKSLSEMTSTSVLVRLH